MKTILVTDDEEGIVEILACLFEDKGYRVIKACDGATAYETLLQDDVDLVISDYMMPGLNGIELHSLITTNRKLQHIPFILISAFAAEVSNAPVTAVFGKPFDIEKLATAVERALSSIQDRSTLEVTGPV